MGYAILSGKYCSSRSQNIIPIPNKRIAPVSQIATDTPLWWVSVFCQQVTACFWHSCPAQVSRLTNINNAKLLVMIVFYKSQEQNGHYGAQDQV
ncbi:hypothetical protein XBJ2_1300100 [Xenorhabdus bovienii str. Jollieti]|uniref:Uncharacterized protein n=1 Tax=Xenorhabdus bovienii (strain SS-2004) TaxID=406818 RepID=D3V1W1_XENBS|nr:hypothetical protein XBJ1_2531 [Xenorhabdus bovienii SS-2004]CDH27549.1 hypothetical protein XBJ2_1300100 [Xenorhabdus bovienii str. Jollieti]